MVCTGNEREPSTQHAAAPEKLGVGHCWLGFRGRKHFLEKLSFREDFPRRHGVYVCTYPPAHRRSSKSVFFFPPWKIPDEHRPMPPPSRWPSFIILPTLVKFQLVWRRLCDVVLLPSSLLEHNFMAVCILTCRGTMARRRQAGGLVSLLVCVLYLQPFFLSGDLARRTAVYHCTHAISAIQHNQSPCRFFSPKKIPGTSTAVVTKLRYKEILSVLSLFSEQSRQRQAMSSYRIDIFMRQAQNTCILYEIAKKNERNKREQFGRNKKQKECRAPQGPWENTF